MAGLSAAAHLPPDCRVLMISLGPETGNSWFAQGGIAAALGRSDSIENHLVDTSQAGDGHVNEKHARELVTQGAILMNDFLDLGFPVTRTSTSEIVFGREAAHSHDRIVHAGGDQTGRYWMQHLQSLTASVERLTVRTIHSLILDSGICKGVRVVTDEHSVVEIYAASTILALGGIGSLYEVSSNSSAAKGTALSLAYHAGVTLVDLEFVQFHPTIAFDGDRPLGLITEAVRGAGAYFTDSSGHRLAIDPLAPRDQVARAVERHWQAGIPVLS